MQRVSGMWVLRAGTVLTAGALLAASPVQLRFDSGSGVAGIGVSVAHAKDGREDREDKEDREDRSDRGGSHDKGGSGKSGSGKGGSDDSRDDDSHDDDSDDDSDDDGHGSSSGKGRDDSGRDDGRSSSDDSRDRDRSGNDDSYEVTLGDGSRVEVENGRFERKDASGRTIEERPATAADRALVGGAATGSARASASRRSHTRGGGVVAKLEVSGRNIEIVYDDGWKEEIDNGVYELKDDLGRTVIERPAKASDSSRLFSAVR